MNAFTPTLAPPKRKFLGLAGVVVLHALLFGAIQAGLDRPLVQQLPPVVQAFLIAEQRPEPPALPPKTPQAAPQAAPPPKPAPLPPPPPAAQVPSTTTPALAPAPTAITAVNATAPTSNAAPAPGTTADAAHRSAAPARTAAGVNIAHCEKPEYPSASRRLEEEGTVSLRFLVGVDGKVVQSEVEKSSGFKRLDEAARAGLSKCQFRPATVDGKPEQAWTTIRYVWRLD